MRIQDLNRKEKEDLYIKKMEELQRRWKNPSDDWDFIKEKWDDKELDLQINNTIGQLRCEKGWDFMSKSLSAVIIGIVVLGGAMLLLFRIRQIFL